MKEDPEKKEARKNQLLNETIPFYLTKFDQIIGENEGYIIPSTTTWADFVFAAALENFEYMFGASALDKYPALQALKKRIHRIPAISDWLSSLWSAEACRRVSSAQRSSKTTRVAQLSKENAAKCPLPSREKKIPRT
ncbi:glutathione S-transferase-like [Bombus huntii]|uniref:glutathione S-transferase-like n=1 Tax=Bombus huntii TaxID=85661 RepID=UPI0021AA06F7|nr:glutathione S-transferase-like [Bombus huntii]